MGVTVDAPDTLEESFSSSARADESAVVASSTRGDVEGDRGTHLPKAADTDQQLKSSRQILAEEVLQGLGELRRPAPGLLMSGLSAGLDVGFSLFFMAAVLTLLGPATPPLLTRVLLGNMYAVGFIFVILGRSELFTEHTALAVFPVLRGSATIGQLARLWVLVYASNLAGAALFALFAVNLGPSLGVIEASAFATISHELVDHGAGTIMLSALAAGWLMGLLSWLVAAAQDTLSRVVLVWLITFGMGLTGLHHCIVGTVEVLSGVFTSSALTVSDFAHFLLWTTLGNTVGGVALVALIKHSHAIRSE